MPYLRRRYVLDGISEVTETAALLDVPVFRASHRSSILCLPCLHSHPPSLHRASKSIDHLPPNRSSRHKIDLHHLVLELSLLDSLALNEGSGAASAASSSGDGSIPARGREDFISIRRPTAPHCSVRLCIAAAEEGFCSWHQTLLTCLPA